MARPLIATKLYAPTRRHARVARPRLLDLLGHAAESRLTLVSAPAGFGKTTLLAEWLAQSSDEGARVAWLSLDPADSDPASFWTYVVTAIQSVLPGVGSTALDLVGSAPLPTELMLTTLLNELAAAAQSLWLVLDDYHVVDSREVGQGLTFLLGHLPPQVHVVLSTRADPDLPLSRWRARQELVEIRAADLRFTSAEAAEYLNEVAGLDLPAESLATLEERTEGWIAALQLVALSIRGRDDVSGFVARFAGNDRYIVDYLVEEVLQHQPDEVSEFLVNSAVLDRLTGSLCDALTGRADGSRMLSSLERANLFIVPLDDRREWHRYHHLFADVLRARLLSERPEQVALLHRQASRWFESHDLTEEAVRHSLSAGDFERAAHLVEAAVPALRRERGEALLFSWVRALPDDVVRRSILLSVASAAMSLLSGDLDAVASRLDDADRALAAEPGAAAGSRARVTAPHPLAATVAVYRASLAQGRGDVSGTAEHARRALALADPGDHLARGSAAGFLGLASWAEGDVRSALRTFGQAVRSLGAAGNLVDELGSTVALADMWLAAGRPTTARRLYERALQLAEPHGGMVARATAELHAGVSEIDCEAGDPDSARRHLDAAAIFVDRAPMSESRYRWFVAQGLLARAEGDLDAAITSLDQAEQLYRHGYLPDVRPIPAMRARVQIAQGRLSEAAAWAEDRRVSVVDDAGYLGEFDQLTLVRLLIAQHRAHPDTVSLERVDQLLGRLIVAAGTSGRAGSVLEIGMLQALAREARGQRPQAQETLARALAEVPEPEGHVRLFLDEGAPMLRLLRDLADHDLANHDLADRGLARRLVARSEASGADPALSTGRPRQLGADPLSGREVQVLRLLDSELSGPQIARELFVSNNTVRTHTKHIYTKLEVTSRRAAVSRARERGLL